MRRSDGARPPTTTVREVNLAVWVLLDHGIVE